VLKLPSTKRSARRKPAIACLFCRERKDCVWSATHWERRYDMQVRRAPSSDPDRVGEIGELTPVLVSVHGARASVNTPQCRGVDFINVVTMAEVITGNPRMRIMRRLHST
jgi:hypothetical protein